MTLIQFFRLLNRNLNLFLLSAATLVVVTYLLTNNLPKTYESTTEIFTGIASGINLDAVESNKVDFLTSATEFDNLINIIKSRETLEEVGIRLLAQHLLLDSIDSYYINEENYGHLKFKIPDSVKEKLIVPYDLYRTLSKIRTYKELFYDDPRVELTFDNPNSPYSFKKIASIGVNRVQSSDLIRIYYSSNDPGITVNTLRILTEVFQENLAKIKSGQTSNVVAYFEKKVAEAAEELNEAEDELQVFRIENRVINYQEQTRSLTIEKEKMEDDYQAEIAKRQAAVAALKKLEQQLSLNKVMIKLGNDVLNKKKDLINLRSKIAELETYLNDADLLQKLRSKALSLEEQVRNMLIQRFQYSRTTDGIPVTTIIDSWLDATLALESSVARVAVFKQRKIYFQEQYDKYAPLGSQFARLGRDIDIKEANYMELLNSLNQALLRQKSELVSSGGQVVTQEPNFPHKENPSKRVLLLLVSGVIGFVVPFLFIVLKELLDSTLRTPQKAEEAIGLKLVGAYPDLTAKSEVKNVDFEWLHEKSAAQLAQNIRLEAKDKGSRQMAKNIVVFSTRDADGKQLTTHVIANELVSLNLRVLVMAPKELPKGETPFYDYVKYDNDKQFINAEHITELIPMGFDPLLYDFVFIVLESILTHPTPLNLLDQFNVAVCVTGAYRDWNRADASALKDFKETMGLEPRLLINGVEPDFISAVLGEIKKDRSLLRRFIKSVLSLQLKSISFGSARKRKASTPKSRL
jgi:succinoglycan biosynthesis transport protein ExoP